MANIIVIEDEQAVRSVIRRLLQRVGHQVREAACGDDGLKLHRLAPADVVITDLHMPGMSGLEVVTELRKSPRVRILVISGSGDTEDDLDGALRAGAHAILPKPFGINQLQEMVEKLLTGDRGHGVQGA